MVVTQLLLIGLLVALTSANYCSYFDNREPSYEPKLRRCSAYRERSCCQPDEEDIGFDIDPIFNGGESAECRTTVGRLRCWICHPRQNLFYANETLTVCEGMCNQLLADCGSARWRDRRVQSYYRNGREFCTEMGFAIGTGSGCFTASAARAAVSSSKLATLVTLFAGFLLTGLLTKSSQVNMALVSVVIAVILMASPISAQTTARASEVTSWADRVSTFISSLANEQLLVNEAQALFDSVEYAEIDVNGTEVVEGIRQRLSNFATLKLNALDRMATAVADEYNQFIRGTREQPFNNPEELPASIYRDSDASDHLPYDQLTFDRRFQYNVNLNQSSVKITSGLDRTNDDLITQINISAVLDPIFKENLANDPFISYQFFGSSTGFMRVYPGRPWQRNVIGFRDDFDPRFRPWFVAATSGPKDVVIVVDTSRSMGDFFNRRWRIALRTVDTLLSTLTKDDYVNVITYRSSHWDYNSNRYVYRPFQVLGCRQRGLQPASAAHQQELMDRLREFGPAGGSNPSSAFLEAYRLLDSSPKTGCQQFVLWVTDEQHGDNDVRCGPGRYIQTEDSQEYVPGPLCSFVSAYETVRNTVRSSTAINNKVRTFSFSVLPKDQVYAAEIACVGNGARQGIDDERRGSIREQSNGFFDFIEQSTRPTDVIWTSPYVDAFGLGLLLTVAQPVVVENNRHIGVVGIDVRLSDIEQILFSQQWGSLYSFMTNEEVEVIVHPRLTPSAELTNDLETPPLELLETRNGIPDLTELRNALRNRETGSVVYSGVPRPVLRGDDLDGVVYEEGTTSNYFYSIIENTDFSFAFNFESDDLTFVYPLEENLTLDTPTVYHELNAYRDVFPDIYNSLDVQQPRTSADYPLSLLTNLNSTIKLAPKAFCDSNMYLRQNNYPNLTFIHNFLNGAGDDVGCDNADGVFEIRARPDTFITSGMEELWKGRVGQNDHLISLSYVGTNAGVMRVFPGVQWSRRYDPTTRPFYHRAVSNRGTLALSYAYRDAAGVGKIITLSEVLYLGKRPAGISECSTPANRSERCECTMASQCDAGRCERGRCVNTQVEAVIGIDIRYDDFHGQMISRMSSGSNPCGTNCESEACPTRCYVIDDSGNVIFSEGLKQANELDTRNYNRVPLGRVEPGVMRDLIRVKNFFIPEPVQVDFQGVCDQLNYFVPLSSEGILRTAEEEDNYLEERGPLRKFQNQFGCVEDIVRYNANPAAIPATTNVISGTQSTTCSSGTYYLTAVRDTNTYLLVIDDWTSLVKDTTFGLNCLVERTLYSAGAHRAINGTCSILRESTSSVSGMCPALDLSVRPVCSPTGQRGSGNVPRHLHWYIMGIIALCLMVL